MSGATARSTGAAGERLAEGWYVANGYQLRERNFRTRFGEIDLVLEKEGMLVFCEVKTRGAGSLATPGASVTPAKQRRLVRAAQGYLMLAQVGEPFMRFDVAEVQMCPGKPSVHVIENAFTL